MGEFMDVPRIGNLKVDKVFFETYYPILFTASNSDKDLFLCVCCQHNQDGIKWLITKTTPETVIRMLSNQCTLRDAFLIDTSIQLTVTNREGIIDFKWNDSDDWNVDSSTDLPDGGEYLDAEEGEFAEEIAYYTALLRHTDPLMANPYELTPLDNDKNSIRQQNIYFKLSLSVCEHVKSMYNQRQVLNTAILYENLPEYKSICMPNVNISASTKMQYEVKKDCADNIGVAA